MYCNDRIGEKLRSIKAGVEETEAGTKAGIVESDAAIKAGMKEKIEEIETFTENPKEEIGIGKVVKWVVIEAGIETEALKIGVKNCMERKQEAGKEKQVRKVMIVRCHREPKNRII